MATKFTCQACGALSATLHASYVDGSMECAGCALLDPFINEQQAARLRRLAKADRTAQGRAEVARRNFHHAEQSEAAATEGASLLF